MAAPRDRGVTTPATQETHGMAVRLFIGNLAYDVTEAELRAHFAALGPLSSLALPTDRDTDKPRGFAFVEFRERADAEEAIRRLNNQPFKGRPLAVSEARARDAQAPPSAPRPAAPRPPSSAAPSAGDGRDFGPDAAPRRRRPPAKRAAQAERGPKRPIYKRAAGPLRFSTAADDGDEEEGRGTAPTQASLTPRSGPASGHDRGMEHGGKDHDGKKSASDLSKA
jgi:RNA recognition motif-containing protein